NREPHEAARFDKVNADIRQNRMKQQMIMATVMPGQEFFTNVSLVLILAVGAWRVMNGSMSLGTLVAFQSYVMTMWMPVRWIGMINQMAQKAKSDSTQLFEILENTTESMENRC